MDLIVTNEFYLHGPQLKYGYVQAFVAYCYFVDINIC